MNKHFAHILKRTVILFAVGIPFVIMSCNNDIEKINALTVDLELPTQSAKDFSVIQHDTGKIQLRINSPFIKRFENVDDPYTEFPDGIEVIFYNENEEPESIITAGYAIYNIDDDLWEARDSVVAQNIITQEWLNTEQLFWKQDEKRIYSNVFTKIINEDGEFHGNGGFRAKQDMSEYELINSEGTVEIEDE